jgi:hypothetical protein
MDDRTEIQDLITGFASGICRRDWAAITELFDPSGSWTIVGEGAPHLEGPNIGTGIKEIVEPITGVVQMNCPSLIKVDGNAATARTTIQEIGVRAAENHRFAAHGIYDDVFVKSSGRWKFKSRRFTGLSYVTTPLA